VNAAIMLIAHKIAPDPNNVPATYFARAAGTARFAYNWALAEWQRQYEACKADASLPKPSQMALRRQRNGIKGEQFPWMLEVTKNAPQMAVIPLGAAFKNFFAGRARPCALPARSSWPTAGIRAARRARVAATSSKPKSSPPLFFAFVGCRASAGRPHEAPTRLHLYVFSITNCCKCAG